MMAWMLLVALEAATPSDNLDALRALAPLSPVTSKGAACANCHTLKGWTDVTFPHEKTGFPLHGIHGHTACTACHPVDFKTAVPTSCEGCHRDVHVGDFGAHCSFCHDELSWKTLFTADAHRRTNFPLTGRHAAIPCQSCHPGAEARRFVRSTVDCQACHLADYQRTAMTGVSHVALGFSMACRQCHDAARFTGARFLAHEACFQLTTGPHVGIRCLGCHTVLPGASTVAGACNTRTAQCTGCHAHEPTKTNSQHTTVPGYQYKDVKCYECHRFIQP